MNVNIDSNLCELAQTSLAQTPFNPLFPHAVPVPEGNGWILFGVVTAPTNVFFLWRRSKITAKAERLSQDKTQ